MTATELVNKSLDYMIMFGPYLLIFFALAFVHKLIDLIYFAFDSYKRRR